MNLVSNFPPAKSMATIWHPIPDFLIVSIESLWSCLKTLLQQSMLKLCILEKTRKSRIVKDQFYSKTHILMVKQNTRFGKVWDLFPSKLFLGDLILFVHVFACHEQSKQA